MSDRNQDVLEWTALGVSGPGHGATATGPLPPWRIVCAPQLPFRGVYLIVTSPGWFIHEVHAGADLVLNDVDGDAYSRDEHDRLERIGQLERHRISFTVLVGNLVSFTVSPKCKTATCGEPEAVLAALAGSGCPHPRLPFSAVIIGVRA